MFGFLIVWMTVVGLGVSVSHCHGVNDLAQSHCLGWGCACNSETTPFDNPSETHSHLILLGFEMPGEHVPGPSLPTGMLQLESATSSAILEVDQTDRIVLVQTELTVRFSFLPRDPFAAATLEVPASKNQLCHFASRLLSGVLVS